jgi:hypothetical protein
VSAKYPEKPLGSYLRILCESVDGLVFVFLVWGTALTPGRADAIGSAGDFNLAGDLQVLAVEADDGKCVVHHALRKQGLAVVAPGRTLRRKNRDGLSAA